MKVKDVIYSYDIMVMLQMSIRDILWNSRMHFITIETDDLIVLMMFLYHIDRDNSSGLFQNKLWLAELGNLLLCNDVTYFPQILWTLTLQLCAQK